MYLPWQSLALWVGVPLLVLGLIIAVLSRGRRSPFHAPSASPQTLSRAEGVVVAIVGTGALLTGGFSVASLVFGGVRVFNQDPWLITNMPIANAEVPQFTEKASAIVDARYESVWIEVAGISAGSRWLFFLEFALPTLAAITISVSVVWLAIALLRGRPFTRALTNSIGVAAIAVMIGGMGAQIAGAVGRASVVSQLGAREITAGDMGAGPYEGFMAFALNLDAAPVGWAFGLALVAAAFQIGTRMQRETELLV